MKRERGIARCGLACCLCTEDCGGCNSGDCLQSVAQNPYTNASGISMTQYSAIYDNAHLTIEVWPYQNYQRSWVFDVTGTEQ